ncbi:dNA-directed DNA polymerase III PolC [Clostridium sp. CAG:567]|jgi:DNA polymerase-3 subunit alpha|nr:dNA-directed DNA polymerase III PolC [Clostridium sp. CAG:567]
MSNFVHLHIHSEFSLLDGANRIKDLPVRAKELGMNAMAITDHGAMFGAIDFYKACKANDIKPIIGCEVYVAPRNRKDKDPNLDAKYNHLILLAKDNQGYKNLATLVSLGYTEGFYYKPRIDHEIIEKYHEGIICLSACLAGEVNQAILANDMEKAKEVALWYKSIFGEDYYLEIQNNGIKEQVLANQKLIQLSRELDIPLVATNDAHYLKREDAYNHEVLLCIQTGKRMTDEDRMKFDTDELYVKSPEEMSDYFKNVPDAIENTVKIAEKCNVEFEFGHTILPNYDVPQEFATHYDYLEKLTYDGLKNRYGENLSKEILERTEYELSVIKKMGYVDYFLIVWDYIHYAKTHNIPVGPGRGSGAGSIVAYSIEITDIDPIQYNLIFERFLNPERISMPDFDVDFCYEKRDKVIEYVEQKYGKDHVSQIITFGTMSARMVIRDVARVLDMPYAEADKLAKMIPNEIHITIKKAMEQNKELKDLYDTDEEIKKMLNIAMALEGMPRQASTHACGIVITKEPVVSYVPLYVRDGAISTQYIMTTLEELGLLKMDFLGLRTLTVIQDTIDLVKQNQGIDVKFDEKMNDPKVYKLWQNGESVGIFQFESQGMTNFMKELKPDCLEDIIAGVSLYRPGPMDQIPRYIANKKDPEHAVYTHPALKPILEVTYGCMVYQEQVMQIVRDLAGYSLGRADLVRRAMGKKKLDVMAKEREIFIHGQIDENGNIVVPGCIRNGIDEKSANKIFDEMAEFAKYAFNKSHAAAYAVISFRTAYLKAYYPTEFMAAMLNSFLGNLDKVPGYIEECKRLSIQILKPDINKSYTRFTVDKNQIRFGLGSIKNVGTAAVDEIVEERTKHGEFKDFSDFCERIKETTVNKKCIESLIKAGAFDELGQTRKTFMASYENIIDTISNDKKGFDGQVSMFDLGGETQKEEIKYNYIIEPEYDEKEKLSMEKEMLGIYISGHPLEKMRAQIEAKTTINSLKLRELSEPSEIEEDEKVTEYQDGQNVIYAGIVTSVKKKYTKNNTIMAFVTIEDLYGTTEFIVFDSCYRQCSDILVNDNIVEVEGRLSIREDEEPKIVARTIKEFAEIKKKAFELNVTNLNEETKEKLKGAIHFFNGERSNMQMQIKNGEKLDKAGGIYMTPEILKQFQELVGEENAQIILI